MEGEEECGGQVGGDWWQATWGRATMAVCTVTLNAESWDLTVNVIFTVTELLLRKDSLFHKLLSLTPMS